MNCIIHSHILLWCKRVTPSENEISLVYEITWFMDRQFGGSRQFHPDVSTRTYYSP